MKRILVLALVSLTLASCGSTKTINDLAVSNPIHSKIDISAVADDKIT